MEYRDIDGIICASYTDEELEKESANVEVIAENTDNTWQKERDSEEKKENTIQGKIAEKIFEKYVDTEFSKYISMISYDLIRCDEKKKHAPFDYLIWEKGKSDTATVIESIRSDIRSSAGRYVKISDKTRELCTKEKIKIVEVKSTKIEERHKQDVFGDDYTNDDLVKKLADCIIEQDDFLCYPSLKRFDTKVEYCIDDYCMEYKQKNHRLTGFQGNALLEQVINAECKKQLCDIFVRVYMDEVNKYGLVLGWLTKEQLYSYDVEFKRMKQKDKSEYALYWAKGLSNSRKMADIEYAVIPECEVYASPFTKTNYYHKCRECQYINKLNDADIIKFRNEKEAIAGGRYTDRCKQCFVD